VSLEIGQTRSGSPVAADGLDRTFLESSQARSLFSGIAGLMEDEAAVLGLVTSEIAWRSLTAKVAVDTRGVDVETAGHIFRDFLGSVGHGTQAAALAA
jgi:hypothetical protein